MNEERSPDSRAETIRSLRARLDQLNRTPVRPSLPSRELLRRSLERQRQARSGIAAAPAPTAPAILYRRDLPRMTPSAPQASPASDRRVVLEQAVTGTEVTGERGAAYAVVTPVEEIEETPDVNRIFAARMEGLAGGRLAERLRRQHDIGVFAPGDFLFVDIETTGLGSSPLFLVGVMAWEDRGLVVRQYLARTYAEEAAVILQFVKALDGRKMVVTFNGKTFDYPYIRNRAAATGVRLPEALPHFDLLHECRRIWKHTLPDCKLQTLERYVCNRLRYGDIPGAQIPQAYHDYVRTGNAWQIVEILKHNMIDIVTLGELMARFPE